MDPFPPQANDPLTDLLRGLLPEPWQRDVSATRYAQGFTLHFTDEGGRRHALEARAVHPDTPALVTGSALAYSYTQLDESLDLTATLEEYRAALTAIAAHEAEILPLLEPRPEAEAGGELSIPHGQPAPDALMEILRAALPEEWRRDASALLVEGNLLLSCHDAGGHQHVFDVRRLVPGAAALVAGRSLAFSYTMVDAALDAEGFAMVDRYRVVLSALAEREAEILPWLSAEAAGGDPGAQGDLTGHSDQVPAEGELSARVLALMPPEWRGDLAVMLITDGFAVSFSDAEGLRHMLEARHLYTGLPSLVSGKHLGFSYFKVDPKLDETGAVPRYREVLQGFVAQEDTLVEGLRETYAAG